MKSYKVIGNVTGLDKGQIVSDIELSEKHAALGGVRRLLSLKAIAAYKPGEVDQETEGEPAADETQTDSGEPPIIPRLKAKK